MPLLLLDDVPQLLSIAGAAFSAVWYLRGKLVAIELRLAAVERSLEGPKKRTGGSW